MNWHPDGQTAKIEVLRMLTVEGQDVIKTVGKVMFVYLLCTELSSDERRKEGHMCSTCCALGGVGMYCVQRFVFVTVVANRPCGGVG